MSILLPSTPFPADWSPRYVSGGIDLEPPAEGVTQRINRIGDKWSVVLRFEKLKMDVHGRGWAAKIMQGITTGVLWPLPLPKDGVGTPGAPVVDGAGQLGSNLALRGLTAGYPFRAMQWVSIVSSGRRYLHMVAADMTADGSGDVTIGLIPMLRVSPADGATVEVAAPKIEGLIPREQALAINRADIVEFSGNLTIREIR